MSLTLTELLARRASSATALVAGARHTTYGELALISGRLAAGLKANGIGLGDRVGVLLPNVPAWPQVLFACARLGAIAVAINTRFGVVEIADVLDRSGCRALVVGGSYRDVAYEDVVAGIDPDRLPALEFVVRSSGAKRQSANALLDGRKTFAYDQLLAQGVMRAEVIDAETPCCMFTTSGTTSLPKFVVHKQSALVTHALATARAFGYEQPDTVTLQATPLCGIYGFTQALASLAAERPVVLLPTFDGDAAVQLAETHRITQFNGTDEMLRQMLRAAGDGNPFPSLRFYGCALFGPAAAEIVAEAECRGVRVRGLYGMSETQALLTLQPDELALAERMQGGGVAVMDAVGIRARDPYTGAVLAHGEPGEIEIRTPGLMVEYFAEPHATAAAMTPDGFFRTGDLGFTRPDGGFVFQSRMGDVLRLGGYLVSPGEIEEHLNRHASVASSQVVGVQVGQKLRAVAFVKSAPGASFSEAELQAHCKASLAHFKSPVRIFPLADFPVTEGPNGRKVQKHLLREYAQDWCCEGGGRQQSDDVS